MELNSRDPMTDTNKLEVIACSKSSSMKSKIPANPEDAQNFKKGKYTLAESASGRKCEDLLSSK
ncbi:hypothetical protein D3C84_1159730 [compost metagenome]